VKRVGSIFPTFRSAQLRAASRPADRDAHNWLIETLIASILGEHRIVRSTRQQRFHLPFEGRVGNYESRLLSRATGSENNASSRLVSSRLVSSRLVSSRSVHSGCTLLTAPIKINRNCASVSSAGKPADAFRETGKRPLRISETSETIETLSTNFNDLRLSVTFSVLYVRFFLELESLA